MTTAIIIPNCGRPEPIREVLLARVINHLTPLLSPRCRILLAEDDQEPYRLCYAINKVVREDTTADVIVVNYADIICPLHQIRDAIHLAVEAPGQVFAYTEYWRVEEPDGDYLIPDAPANACMAIRRDNFIDLGGYDEHFRGWALEDRDFNDRAQAAWPARRVEGRCEHLYHGERRRDDSALGTPAEQVAENRAYYAQRQRDRARGR